MIYSPVFFDDIKLQKCLLLLDIILFMQYLLIHYMECLTCVLFSELFWRSMEHSGFHHRHWQCHRHNVRKIDGMCIVFTRKSSYCFQHVLAVAILSVCPSVCHTGGSVKAVQARITKSSPSAAWKTLVSGTVKLFHKFEGVTPNECVR